ncbi:hypothetical protein HK104_000585 [Borealophlyctis nickersoniae]|nr:hypothetical protein HK104_000585 [Borealophlyctis nickersoniae]
MKRMAQAGHALGEEEYLLLAQNLPPKDPTSADAILKEMYGLGIPITASMYNRLGTSLCAGGHFHEAMDMYQKLKGTGARLDERFSNSLISGSAQRDSALACRFHQQLRSDGVQFSLSTYKTLLQECGRGRNWDGLRNILDELRAHGPALNAEIYSVLVKAYSRGERITQARELLKQAEAEGISLDMKGFKPLIIACIKHRNVDMLDAVMADIDRLGIKRDVHFYGTFVESYSTIGEPQKVELWLQKAAEAGVTLTLEEYGSALQGYCVAGDMERAEALWSKIQRSGLRPNQFCYALMVEGYARKKRLGKAVSFFQEMKAQELTPSKHAYGSLIKGHLLVGDVEKAKGYLYQMVASGNQPDIIAYSMFINHFARVKQIDYAVKWLNRAKAAGLKPNATAYGPIVDYYAKKGDVPNAQMWYDRMVADGEQPDQWIMVQLMDAYSRASLHSKAREIWEGLLAMNVALSPVAIGTWLDICAFAGTVELAEKTISDLRAKKYPLDANHFCSWIQVYTRAKMWRQAVNVLRAEMPKDGVVPVAKTFSTLLQPLRFAKRKEEETEVVTHLKTQYPRLVEQVQRIFGSWGQRKKKQVNLSSGREGSELLEALEDMAKVGSESGMDGIAPSVSTQKKKTPKRKGRKS